MDPNCDNANAVLFRASPVVCKKPDGPTPADLRDDVAQVVPPDSIEYFRSLSDEELDAQVVGTMSRLDALSSQKRQQIKARLLPLLLVLRDRYAQPGRRVVIPGCPTWTEYLRGRGLKPDTVRSWFRKTRSAEELAQIVGEAKPKKHAKQQEPDLLAGDVAGLLLLFAKKLGKPAIQVFGSLGIEDFIVAFREFVRGMATAQGRNIMVNVIADL